jgi:hypothetical protein
MDKRQATLTETHSSEHVPNDGELILEVKVLRSTLRTSLKGGTAQVQSADLQDPTSK